MHKLVVIQPNEDCMIDFVREGNNREAHLQGGKAHLRSSPNFQPRKPVAKQLKFIVPLAHREVIVKLSFHVRSTLSSGCFLSIAWLSIPNFLSIAASHSRIRARKPVSCSAGSGCALPKSTPYSEDFGEASMSKDDCSSFSSVVRGCCCGLAGPGAAKISGSPCDAIVKCRCRLVVVVVIVVVMLVSGVTSAARP